MNPRFPGYSAPDPLLPTQPRLPFDVRWGQTAVLIVGLMGVGTFIAWRQGPSLWVTFSAQVAQIYCPLAAVLILTLGFTPRGYAVAAGIFYGFLPLGQSASDHFFLLGDVTAAVTFEMVVAIPLILVGFLGPSGADPRLARPLPPWLKFAWILLLASACLSTVLALSPQVAVAALFSRFVIPVLVTLGAYRRLRNIADYRIVWFGFVVGMTILTVYNVRRAVYDINPWYSDPVDQRFAGATKSFAIPALYLVGPALWYGHALAIKKTLLQGAPWLALTCTIGLLLWLGGHRAPVLFFALLVVWWLPGHFLRYALHGKGLIITVLGGAAAFGLVSYFLTRTVLNTDLLFERMQEGYERGLADEPRWQLWLEGLSYWLSSPLWGLGINNWVVVNQWFESVHSSVIGILIDTGLLGATAFTLLFSQTLLMVRKSHLPDLPHVDREFVLGCRAGWVLTLLLLSVDLSFTSGQPKNSAFAYMVYFFPLLVMVVHARYPRAVPQGSSGRLAGRNATAAWRMPPPTPSPVPLTLDSPQPALRARSPGERGPAAGAPSQGLTRHES